MNNIELIFKVFEELEHTSKESEKIKLLSKIKDLPELKWITLVVESKDKKTNLSYDYLYKIPNGSKQQVTFKDFQQLTEQLINGKLTGKKKETAVKEFFSKCNDFYAKWYKRILSKNLRINVGKSIFNKVIGLTDKDYGIKFKPMLATDLKSLSENQVNKLFQDEFNWYAEVKIDGLRMLTIFENESFQCYSRNSKRLYNAEKILANGLTPVMVRKLQGYVIDGEFYNTNWSDTMSSLMRKTELPSRLHIEDMYYYIFDLLTVTGLESKSYNVPYLERKKKLYLISKQLDKPFTFVSTQQVSPPYLTNLEKLANKFISEGWEGAVAKLSTGTYENKRSKYWIKFKKFYTEDVLCTGIIKSNKNNDEIAAITFKYKNKTNCKCGSGFSEKQRKLFLKQPNLIVGKVIELKFQEQSVDGCLRFPTFVRIRLDKDIKDLGV